jgi:translation initiation factor 2B subunit (eIF-2B alpha/beta/delta family)
MDVIIMTIEEICKYVEDIASTGETISTSQLKKILQYLYKIIQQQNESMHELKNGCIRLENNIKMVEDKLSKYAAYKELCETILDNINSNPISALCFLYKVKHKINKYNEYL